MPSRARAESVEAGDPGGASLGPVGTGGPTGNASPGLADASVAEAMPDIVCVAKLAADASPRTAPPDPLYIKGADARPLAEQASG